VTNAAEADFPYVVPFELGDAEFATGDKITILSMRGTSETLRVGETYCVEGAYTLASAENADVALFATTRSNVSAPTERSQIVRIEKGTGSFRLIKTMREEGYLHVSFYPVLSGSAFGGIYFGQGKSVLRHKGFSYFDYRTGGPDRLGGGAASEASPALSGPNRVLFEYLGNPVPPPANMDAAYSKTGLVNAMQTAAGSAGVSLKKIEIDDSEFPFLVGVICQEGDYPKLVEQIKKVDAYEYSGSVGSRSCNAMNLVPYRAFPPEASQRISRRTTLREQMLFDKINGK
jgi:hypothetical protein